MGSIIIAVAAILATGIHLFRHCREEGLASMVSVAAYYAVLFTWLESMFLFIRYGGVLQRGRLDLLSSPADIVLFGIIWILLVIFLPQQIRKAKKGKAAEALQKAAVMQRWALRNGIGFILLVLPAAATYVGYMDVWKYTSIMLAAVYLAAFAVNVFFVSKQKEIQVFFSIVDVMALLSLPVCSLIRAEDVGVCAVYVILVYMGSCPLYLLYRSAVLDVREGSVFCALLDGYGRIDIKEWGRTFLLAMLPTGLLLFEFFMENTLEFYCVNISVFAFSNADYYGNCILYFLVLLIWISFFFSILRKEVYQILLTGMAAAACAAYIQVMFLNGSLGLTDLADIDWNSYLGDMVMGGIVWAAVFVFFIVLAVKKKRESVKVIGGISGALLMMQLAAAAYLFVSVGGWNNEPGRKLDFWCLTGKEQYAVSENENVIVIILDTYSNDYYDAMLEKYPDAMEEIGEFRDFTYYSNYDGMYDGTMIAMPNIVTGVPFDNTLSCREYLDRAFHSGKTTNFYQMLQDKGYTCRIFTDMSTFNWLGYNRLQEKFSNIEENPDHTTDINSWEITERMWKASAYRLFPMALKRFFLITTGEFDGLVTVGEQSVNGIDDDAEFYRKVREENVYTESTEGDFIIQHFLGMHSFIMDKSGSRDAGYSMEDAAYGNLYGVAGYIKELKRLGVYEAATIIVTADHGVHESLDGLQPVFFIKEPYASHDRMEVSAAPVSVGELIPTIAYNLGEDTEGYGNTIYDYSEGEERERVVYLRRYDENYPKVPKVDNSSFASDAYMNCLYEFSYTGDKEDLRMLDVGSPDKILTLVDFWW